MKNKFTKKKLNSRHKRRLRLGANKAPNADPQREPINDYSSGADKTLSTINED